MDFPPKGGCEPVTAMRWISVLALALGLVTNVVSFSSSLGLSVCPSSIRTRCAAFLFCLSNHVRDHARGVDPLPYECLSAPCMPTHVTAP
jgi:hypothetical protein